MGAPAQSRSSFGQQLRQQLDQHKTIKSVRRLAREMSPERPDSARRMLHDWIAGAKRPTRASRRVVAVALGVDASVFSDDDEEEDMLSDLAAFLQRKRKRVLETGDLYAVVA